MKICIVGLGYVGTSLSFLFQDAHEVLVFDKDKKKLEMLDSGISPIKDDLIEDILNKKRVKFKLKQELDREVAFCDFVIICISTDLNSDNRELDVSGIKTLVEELVRLNEKVTIVIKSTVPIGLTESLQAQYEKSTILFSPEFLREGSALYDNFFPDRIIVGGDRNTGKIFSDELKSLAKKKNVPVLLTNNTEAETIKLCSNSYLAMRVAFFNEIDNLCINRRLKSKDVMFGISLDKRIGDIYNNPSFGYGGYCLPKDLQQLVVEFNDIPNNLLSSVEKSNSDRVKFLARIILDMSVKTVGIYRLIMKKGSDNFRESKTLTILRLLIENKVTVILYEPIIREEMFEGAILCNDLVKFKKESDMILSNRIENEISDVKDKIFTRDIFGNG